uniref:NADH-ubiquinone oxidoreductase chain 4L n=1 Tax=Coleoptera sp. ACP-2013 TaxID=2485033 RepID=A0A3G3MEK2_9COLE|nr:NADH dehydrogenase subunit 4L [Coleoptera sp. ACP-2013]
MLMYLMISIFMFFSSFMVFISKRKHLLLMLLSLEMIIISLYLNMFYLFSELTYEYFFSMIYLTMSVCESALGLSLLVLMIRTYGNDYMTSFTLLW